MNLVSFKVGKGDSIWFWGDVWCSPSSSLKEAFPSISSLEGSVRDHLVRHEERVAWNLHLRRPLNDWELEHLTTLLDGCSVGNGNEEDRWLWMPDNSGKFSVKSCFSFFHPQGLVRIPMQVILEFFQKPGFYSSLYFGAES